ncbi:hypothetical protein [Streptomyces sp. G-G2]|uniref:hypothetical protein n=1 Tax=Streptomyces sp. G-G2 TaxID=3046201 RepID=UPI0024B9E887|nr:hypothetical protein [Streptomyces sp. G-G2]MDJ0383217.1 hypothetical protein [Streptomyces sp. G-G2]
MLIVLVILVTGIILLPWVWPAVQSNPAFWPLVIPVALSVLRLSRRSHIRIVRLRRS